MAHLDEILTIKGKNLFDGVMEDGNIGNDGQDAGTNAAYYRSKNYTSVIPGEKYQFSFNTVINDGQFYIIEYDKNKGFISRTPYNGFVRTEGFPNGYTASANAAYIRFFIYSGNPYPHSVITWVQLEKNATITPYEPYTGEFKSIGGVTGKNLFDKDRDNICINGFVSNAGAFSGSMAYISKSSYSSTTAMVSLIYPVKSGKTYWLDRGNLTTSAAYRLLFTKGLPTEENIVGSFIKESTSVDAYKITIPDGATYVVLYIRHANDTYTVQDRLNLVMLSEGETQPTSYEPYTARDIWQRAVPTTSTKGATTSINNSRKSVNLFDKNTVTLGNPWCTSDYIPVKENTKYTICNTTVSSTAGVVCYDGNKTQIGEKIIYQGLRIGGLKTITTYAGTRFIVVQSNLDRLDIFQVVEGEFSTAPPYYPYFAPEQVLPSLKAFGGQVQRHKQDKLWSRYVPCEYIKSQNGECIDTGIIANNNTEVELDYAIYSTGSVYIFGTRVNSTQYFTISGSQIGGTNTNFVNGSSANVNVGNRISGVWNRLYQKVATNNGTVTWTAINKDTQTTNSGTYSATVPELTETIKLFSNSTEFESNGRIYKNKLKQNGVLVRDMIPVKDIVDNVYGMYDRVNDKFYGNAGTGSFTGGDLIQPIQYVDLNDNYVDIGHRTEVGSTYKQELEFMISELDTTKFTAICGADNGLYLGVTTDGQFAPHNLNNSSLNIPVSVGVWHKVVDTIDTSTTSGNNFTGTFDGVSYSSSRSSFGSSAWSIGGLMSISYHHKVKIRKYRVWKDDVLIYDFASAKVGSSSGFIDYLTGTIYDATDFQYGPDIPYDILVPQALKCNRGDIAYGQYGKNMLDKALYDNHGWYYSSGVIADAPAINATVVIRAIPNKTYYFKHCSVTGGARVMYTTEENWSHGSTCEWLIASPTTQQPNTVLSFTVPSNAKWIFLLVGRIDSATTATLQEQLNDFMMSEEVITADTPYEPYRFGLHADGSHKVFIGQQGVVDLGSLTWIYQTDGTYPVFRATLDAPLVATGAVPIFTTSHTVYPNPITATYLKTNLFDKTIAYQASSTSNQLMVQDSRYATAADFKAAMSGKYLFYQRNTDASFITPTVREVNDLLYSANDYTDIQTGKKHNEWDIKVLDGVTNGLKFKGVSSLSTFYFSSVSETGIVPTMSIICTHFLNKNALENWVCYAGNNAITFHHSYPTVAEANAWLASEYAKGTPVIVIYPLVTPTDTDIVTEKVALTSKGSKTITTSAEIPVTVQATDLEK